jgi:hypothetical protein
MVLVLHLHNDSSPFLLAIFCGAASPLWQILLL